MAERQDKPNFSQGWGIAAFVTALAAGAFALAGTIKSNTFHSPNDVLVPAASSEPAQQAAH